MITVLADGDGFVAIEKKSGDLVIPDRFRAEGPTLFDRAKAELGGELLLVHRLDRGTSGVLLLARSTDAQRELSKQFEEGGIEKEYVALCDGVARTDSGRVDAPLGKGRKGRMKIDPAGKPSITNWRVLERFAAHTFVEARPETGRTHQIRVHLSSLDLPIVGDDRYNFSKRPPVISRLALHARAIRFTLASNAHHVEAPLPSDLVTALAGLRA